QRSSSVISLIRFGEKGAATGCLDFFGECLDTSIGFSKSFRFFGPRLAMQAVGAIFLSPSPHSTDPHSEPAHECGLSGLLLRTNQQTALVWRRRKKKGLTKTRARNCVHLRSLRIKPHCAYLALLRSQSGRCKQQRENQYELASHARVHLLNS